MRRSRRTTVVVALVLGLAAATMPAATAAAPGSERQASVTAKKKKKAKKCKKGRVRERIQKKTRCLSARKAWPKPKAIDMRKAAASYVLNASYSKLRDRRGKRLPSLPKLLRKVHPRAEKALLGATKAGLARFDARARVAQAPCGGGPEGASTSSTYDAGGGLSVGITSTFGADAAMQLNLESNRGNRRVRIEIEFPSCGDGSQIDSCPTADGTVRGRDNTRVGLRAYLYEGNTEVWSQGIGLQGETTFRGVVGDDAKLEFMEPHNTETATITLGGSSRGFEPVTMRTLIQRITRVDMKTGEYVLGPSIINVSISSRGLGGSEQRAVELQVGASMRQQADQQFRDIIDKAIRKYRERENAWNEPNTCATVDFTPASNSRTLKIGDTGVVSARVRAKPGGSPDRATWTRLGATNATFSPDTGSSVPVNFSYRDIVAAGQGITVTGTFKAVSKAGVAQGTWTQPTENLDVNTIAGTFSGVWKAGGSILGWSGVASFARALPGPGANGTFFLTSGRYTVTASGKDATGATGCVQSGTKTVTLTNNGNITVTGQGPGQTAPYEYTGTAAGIGPGDANMMVTLSSCPDPMYNGQRFTIGLPFTAFDTVGGKASADGLDYTGASSRSAGGLTQDWHWAMHGAP